MQPYYADDAVTLYHGDAQTRQVVAMTCPCNYRAVVPRGFQHHVTCPASIPSATDRQWAILRGGLHDGEQIDVTDLARNTWTTRDRRGRPVPDIVMIADDRPYRLRVGCIHPGIHTGGCIPRAHQDEQDRYVYVVAPSIEPTGRVEITVTPTEDIPADDRRPNETWRNDLEQTSTEEYVKHLNRVLDECTPDAWRSAGDPEELP